jgi:dienelactone hydrolase
MKQHEPSPPGRLGALNRRSLLTGLGLFSAGAAAGELVPRMVRSVVPRLSSEKEDWTNHAFIQDPVMNDQFRWHLSQMLHGAADLGECLSTAQQIQPGDEEGWLQAWLHTAQRVQGQAEESLKRNKRVSAASAFERAANYYRAALIHYSFGTDARVREICDKSVKCLNLAHSLSGYPAMPVQIPYEGTALPGYFFRSPTAAAQAPLLILHQGRDAWPEDTKWVYDGAIRRGIHCLIFHGPGQGLPLRLQGLAFRPDWEKVITPVVDFALGISGVDPARLALMGLSFGGFLAPRAMAFEKRIKICIANPGVLNWAQAIYEQFSSIPGVLPLYGRSPGAFNEAVAALARAWPTAGWWFRDAAAKHGVTTPADLFKVLAEFNNEPFVDRITCQMLIMDGTGEVFSAGQARKLFDALRGPKEFMLFDETSAAHLHCQNAALAHAGERLFDWLDERL